MSDCEPLPPHPTRVECTRLLTSIGLSDLEARDLEIGVFNFTIDYITGQKLPASWICNAFVQAYLAKARGVYQNILKAPRLLNRMHEKEFLPHDIALMKHQNLMPEAWEAIINKEQMRNKAAYETLAVANTDRYVCSRCKKNQCSYYELQTRSSDESMTCFISCLNCGNRWRLG